MKNLIKFFQNSKKKTQKLIEFNFYDKSKVLMNEFVPDIYMDITKLLKNYINKSNNEIQNCEYQKNSLFFFQKCKILNTYLFYPLK